MYFSASDREVRMARLRQRSPPEADGPGLPPARPRARRLRPARDHPQLAAGAHAPLRPEPVPHVLLHEHVRVQLRHPQPPVRRPLQVAQRRPDVAAPPCPRRSAGTAPPGRPGRGSRAAPPPRSRGTRSRAPPACAGRPGRRAGRSGPPPAPARPRSPPRRGPGPPAPGTGSARSPGTAARRRAPGPRRSGGARSIWPRSTCQGARNASVAPRGAATVLPAASIT